MTQKISGCGSEVVLCSYIPKEGKSLITITSWLMLMVVVDG